MKRILSIFLVITICTGCAIDYTKFVYHKRSRFFNQNIDSFVVRVLLQDSSKNEQFESYLVDCFKEKGVNCIDHKQYLSIRDSSLKNKYKALKINQIHSDIEEYHLKASTIKWQEKGKTVTQFLPRTDQVTVRHLRYFAFCTSSLRDDDYVLWKAELVTKPFAEKSEASIKEYIGDYIYKALVNDSIVVIK